MCKILKSKGGVSVNYHISEYPIRELLMARGHITSAIEFVKEFHGEDLEVIYLLQDAFENLNFIQRWCMRNSSSNEQ